MLKTISQVPFRFLLRPSRYCFCRDPKPTKFSEQLGLHKELHKIKQSEDRKETFKVGSNSTIIGIILIGFFSCTMLTIFDPLRRVKAQLLALRLKFILSFNQVTKAEVLKQYRDTMLAAIESTDNRLEKRCFIKLGPNLWFSLTSTKQLQLTKKEIATCYAENAHIVELLIQIDPTKGSPNPLRFIQFLLYQAALLELECLSKELPSYALCYGTVPQQFLGFNYLKRLSYLKHVESDKQKILGNLERHKQWLKKEYKDSKEKADEEHKIVQVDHIFGIRWEFEKALIKYLQQQLRQLGW